MDVLSKKDSILLKGRAKKSASRNQIDAAKPKKIKAKLKIADTCKITFADEDENVTGYYKDWITNGGGGDYKEDDEMCFTTVNIKVRNKKIVKIIFLINTLKHHNPQIERDVVCGGTEYALTY